MVRFGSPQCVVFAREHSGWTIPFANAFCDNSWPKNSDDHKDTMLVKLPNAPLVEVVFELRWALRGGRDLPLPLRTDPGFELLAECFTETAAGQGFSVRKDMDSDGIGILGHSVKYRYLRSEDKPFPLWQIGPGIFACNQATEYDWKEFRDLISGGVRALFSSYPKSKTITIQPIYLELRYIDVFNMDLLGHYDLIRFLSKNTNFSLDLSDFMKSERFEGETSGSLRIVRSLRDDKDTQFQLEVGTGQSNKKRSLVASSKVMKRGNPIDLGDNIRTRTKNITQWLDNAHKITSPFFEDFVSSDLMDKFATKSKKVRA